MPGISILCRNNYKKSKKSSVNKNLGLGCRLNLRNLLVTEYECHDWVQKKILLF
jgi:hypothetical protein